MSTIFESLKSMFSPKSGGHDDDGNDDPESRDPEEGRDGSVRGDGEADFGDMSGERGDKDDSQRHIGKNGHLYVDGVDLGPVSTGSMTGPEDVLELLQISPNVQVPKEVFLPDDLRDGNFRKFDDESPGFSKQQVAAFFDKSVASAEYLQKMLDRRNKDIMALAKYVDRLNASLQDQELEKSVLNSSGMNVIAGGDDSQTIMSLTLKNQKLQAQVEAMRNGKAAGAQDDELKAKLADVTGKYDKIQDQLGREQYLNRQLMQERDDLKTRLGIKEESDEDGIDGLTADITKMDDPAPERRPQPGPQERRRPADADMPQRIARGAAGNQDAAGRAPAAKRDAPQVSLRPSKTQSAAQQGTAPRPAKKTVSLKPSRSASPADAGGTQKPARRTQPDMKRRPADGQDDDDDQMILSFDD